MTQYFLQILRKRRITYRSDIFFFRGCEQSPERETGNQTQHDHQWNVAVRHAECAFKERFHLRREGCAHCEHDRCCAGTHHDDFVALLIRFYVRRQNSHLRHRVHRDRHAVADVRQQHVDDFSVCRKVGIQPDQRPEKGQQDRCNDEVRAIASPFCFGAVGEDAHHRIIDRIP